MTFCPHGQNFINVITLNVIYMEQIKCALYILGPCAVLCVITTQLFAAVFSYQFAAGRNSYENILYFAVLLISCVTAQIDYGSYYIGRHKK